MTAGPQMLDVATGQPVGGSAYKQPTAIYQNQNTSGRADASTTGTSGTTNQTQNAYTDILNTTAPALNALNALIATMTERPAISQEELDAKAPLPAKRYTPSGWVTYDPLTGFTIPPMAVNSITARRKAEQDKLRQEAGTIPAGTEEQQTQQANRQQEITRNRQQQAGFTRETAFSDAQSIMNKAIADSLRQTMPDIVRASEGAGTSKSTFRALATQEAATRAGTEAAALGANLNVQYGQIYNQLSGILEALTRSDPNGPTGMLLQALNAAKGSIQAGNTGSTTQGQQQQRQNTNAQQGPTQTQSNENRQYEGTTLGQMPNFSLAAPNVAAPSPTYNMVVTRNIGATEAPIQSGGTFDAETAYEAIVTDDAY